SLAANRSQFFLDIPSGAFYGYNRPGAKVSQGIIQNSWRQAMMGSALAQYEEIKAFSETDQTDDLKAITVPTLVMQGEDDQFLPYQDHALLQAKLLKHATLKIYLGFPHGMMTIHADVINPDILAFINTSPDWTEPFPPFHIAGNLYYVGSKGLANYLIATPQGNILVNSDLEADVPMIRASITKLGFKFEDTKILLISHAHFDHDAASATIKEMTGATYMVMDADAPVVESGGKMDFQYGSIRYRPTKVDRVLHDGDEVRLGGTVLVAHLTPGHTKGCTTWTMKVTERSKTYDVVIVGSPNVNPGYKLVDNTAYPQIAEDYERMWRILKSLPCDIFLGAHGDYFGLEKKYSLMKEGATNPFVDPEGYKNFIAQKERDFCADLAKQEITAK
ncbi:MAG TPA: subclass B3 metallo-beta-lactamase, partial [Terriglobales bacterium]